MQVVWLDSTVRKRERRDIKLEKQERVGSETRPYGQWVSNFTAKCFIPKQLPPRTSMQKANIEWDFLV